MRLSHDDVVIDYDKHDCPTVVIKESEINDWPGCAGVLRIKIVKDDGRVAFFHITAAVASGKPKVSVESFDMKKTLTGKWKNG